MARVVAPVVSEYFRNQHEAKGVDILLSASLDRIGEKEVVLRERTRRPADLVIAGIGVVPNMELARDIDTVQQLAHRQYGLMAKLVLAGWGIQSTSD
jgi:3-phenylpropionate/trans-cinnamate dioxygenase ferredoxin reductase subunit